jgi:hypothetical protein
MFDGLIQECSILRFFMAKKLQCLNFQVRLFGQTLETSSKVTEDIKMLKAEIESAPKPHTGGKFSMAGALRLAQKIEKRAERKNASEEEGNFYW